MKKIAYLLLGSCIVLAGCNTFKKIGSDLGEGLDSKTRPLGKNLIMGIDDGLTQSAIRADLYKTIDSAITIAGSSTNRNFKKVLNSLLTERWSVFVKQLIENATGKQTHQNLEQLREAVIGAKTKKELQELVASVLNDENTGRLILLKNKILGNETNKQFSTIIDTGMLHLSHQFQSGITDPTLDKLSHFLKNDLSNSLDKNLSVVQRYASWFLVGIGLLAASIITIVWFNRQKYLKLSTLLASHVNAIPDQHIYDQLTSSIKLDAVTAGIEPTLRGLLSENHLLNEKSWKPLDSLNSNQKTHIKLKH
jgi:predicted small secreted protein